jgi:hypothetical protein
MIADRVQLCEDRTVCTRIIGEYLEMPGLNVTIPQACRLWDIDAPRCAHLLETLLASGFLRKRGECYVRADAGRHAA